MKVISRQSITRADTTYTSEWFGTDITLFLSN